MLITH